MSPRRVGPAADIAGCTATPQILAIGYSDNDLVAGDPGNLMACAREKMFGNMFQDFGAKDCIELVFGKLQVGNIALDRLDVGMVDLGFIKIESNNLVESFGELHRKEAIACSDVEGQGAAGRKECEQICDALLFGRA